MSLTAAIWFSAFIGFTVLSLSRSSWCIPMYLMTFYASPRFWWWGGSVTSIIGDRVNLIAAVIFAGVVLFHSAGAKHRLTPEHRKIFFLLLLYAINATVIHFAFASNPVRSEQGMTMIWKQLGLLVLITATLQARIDFDLLVSAIIIGSLYIAFEIVVNDRGRVSAGRLEGVGAPGASEANYLAGLMCLMIPLAGYRLFFGTTVQRGLAVVSLVLVFEVILRCSSRGAFLALIIAGGWLLMSAKGRARKYAIYGLALGVVAALFMLKNEQIIDRFFTVFASGETRDSSAQSRLDFWKAAVDMIANHPVGSGAEAAFKSDLGRVYLRKIGVYTTRAVHNGYLDMAAAWGIQGFFFYLSAIFCGWRLLQKRCREASQRADEAIPFLGASLQATVICQLVICLFISSLDGEWFFWWFAMVIGFDRLYMSDTETVPPAVSLQSVPAYPHLVR